MRVAKASAHRLLNKKFIPTDGDLPFAAEKPHGWLSCSDIILQK